MPRTRGSVDSQQKLGEILAGAESLFVEKGFAGTRMQEVAAAAGITPNTIYWYVDDKDALLVAVVSEVVARSLREAAELADSSWREQLMWVLRRLQHHHRLVAAVHARAPVSATVDRWHEGFHELADALLQEGFREAGIDDRQVDVRARMAVLVIEGLITHPVDDATTVGIMDLLVPDALPRVSG